VYASPCFPPAGAHAVPMLCPYPCMCPTFCFLPRLASSSTSIGDLSTVLLKSSQADAPPSTDKYGHPADLRWRRCCCCCWRGREAPRKPTTLLFAAPCNDAFFLLLLLEALLRCRSRHRSLTCDSSESCRTCGGQSQPGCAHTRKVKVQASGGKLQGTCKRKQRRPYLTAG
jgi:hypothetical protein